LIPEKVGAVSEIIRTVVSKLRRYVGDRRSLPRMSVRLPFSLTIQGEGAGNGRKHESIDGYTMDISATGLGLIVRAVRIDGYYIFADGRPLKIVLNLPEKPMTMLVTPARCERLDDSGDVYVVGVRIVAINDQDRQQYLQYLARGLARKLRRPT